MSKFEIEYYTINTNKVEIEARHDSEAVDKFRKEYEWAGIKTVKYVYEGNEEPTEWYCNWWNGHDWKSKVVIAHNEEEIRYNIKNTLDFAVYDFRCCPNTEKAIDGLMRSKWD